jgi:hypothetical protein
VVGFKLCFAINSSESQPVVNCTIEMALRAHPERLPNLIAYLQALYERRSEFTGDEVRAGETLVDCGEKSSLEGGT